MERTNDATMVATLEKHKDHRTLLEAWKILEDKGVLVAKESSSALAESVYDLLNSTTGSNNLSIKEYLRKFIVSEVINHYKRLANLN